VEDSNLLPEQITRGLNTRFIGQKVIYYRSVSSTNEAAVKEARWGAPAGTVVVTEEQTAGRGRLKRTWLTPKGGLALSVILRPNLEFLPYTIMIASLAASYSIEDVTGIKPQIKWPNDIMIRRKKVCGILIENDIRRNNLVSTVIGLGINVNVHIAEYPDIASFATSLADQTGSIVSRLDIVRQLLIEMERLYRYLPQTEAIFTQWKSRLMTLGQVVQVTQNETVISGIAESVTPDGNLVLRDAEGELIKISAGDVVHLREDI
jgi:BirA family biotin operon repressor/biotin-[acetyl-CoA-carboxylase] ligase